MVKKKDYIVEHKLIIPLFILMTNYEELMSALRYHNSKDALNNMLALRYRHRQEAFVQDVKVLIVNFVASAKMMVEHCRNAIRDVRLSRKFHDEYEQEKQKLILNNCDVAIIELLNSYYVHHFNHPLTRHEDFNKSFEDGFARFTADKDLLIKFCLNKIEYAKKHDNNTTSLELALSYLHSVKEEVEIEVLIKNYYETVEGLYFWLLSRLKSE